MQIRRATAADISALLMIEREAAGAAHWSEQQYHDAFDESSPERLFLAAAEGDAVHGFLAARSVEGEWEIENIAVAQPRRRQGIGAGLLQEFLNYVHINGATAVFLEVRESNRAARALYERRGFCEVGLRFHYYRQPDENAVLYRFGASAAVPQSGRS